MSEAKLSEGLRAITARDYLGTIPHSKQTMRAVRDGCHPRIIAFEKVFIARMNKLGIPMYAHCMMRTRADQRRAYVQGFSRNDGSKDFPHLGCAVDIVHGLKHWELSKDSWSMLGHIGKELAVQNGLHVRWGREFKSIYDPAHWELEDWRHLVQSHPLGFGTTEVPPPKLPRPTLHVEPRQ